MLPIRRILDVLNYKCELEGIKVVFINEAYTSKCSFVDKEEICKHVSYKGKRITRGLFKTENGRIINADVNAAYNILSKFNGITISDCDPLQVFSTPAVLNILYGASRKECSHRLKS